MIHTKKSDKQKDNWNDFYLKSPKLKTDTWLEKYHSVLPRKKSQKVLDIGCGSGLHIPYYIENEWEISAIDYSETAIEIVQTKYPNIQSYVIDIREGFPFYENSISLIIADLSLHYFSSNTTREILQNIKKLMTDDAVMLARVNSVNDVDYGSGKGNEIESGYFEYQGRYKRFFTKEMIQEFMSPHFKLEHIEEINIDRYNSNKWVWEIAVHNL